VALDALHVGTVVEQVFAAQPSAVDDDVLFDTEELGGKPGPDHAKPVPMRVNPLL
jgi:hypothetical protein